MGFARTVPDAHQAVRGPVDLHAIARFKGQFEVSLVANRSHRGDKVIARWNKNTRIAYYHGLVYDLPAIDTYAKYRANVTPAPVSIVDRGTF